ncbi:MAG: hypothetical protein A3B14_00240 [Candidatus Zambryskibacteria bacterium RIFCSPLOWO2_01_FULL_45_21]|uniref:Uncharacterized protein n=1 Tax=Candidatus Zambryskibacteria bacterium RIFCSPLOWO2_01_FULL_45_21 TaxID=1802761 RepID=A0A1G2U0Z5_9BACT|nr:MAG: hypothetical protein A3B14_00240 [Candidatus Zambryskibacteria bacterium RIFCSPLOWO2_01_FULL_45_21]
MATETNSALSFAELLEAAAHLCLREAAFTDYDAFPPGSGEIKHRESHSRRGRFEQAAKMLKEGTPSVREIGLLPEDLFWAAKQAEHAKDPKSWRSRLEAAERELAGILDAEALRKLDSQETYIIYRNPSGKGGFQVRLVGADRRPRREIKASKGGPGAIVNLQITTRRKDSLDLKPLHETEDIIGGGRYFHQAIDMALTQLHHLQGQSS